MNFDINPKFPYYYYHCYYFPSVRSVSPLTGTGFIVTTIMPYIFYILVEYVLLLFYVSNFPFFEVPIGFPMTTFVFGKNNMYLPMPKIEFE